MTILLDSSVLIDALNHRKGRHAFLGELVSRNERLACCAITVAEIYAGMKPKEARDTAELLASLEYFETTRTVAQRAGTLKSAWAAKGVTLSLPDALIAAVAIEYDLVLATENRKDFPMPDLRLLALPGRTP